MIADWVKETTTTTGTGTITLAGAASGYCSFSDVLVDGMVVRYQIIDANGTSREMGYGTYTASGTTLTRGPIATLVGGTYALTSTALTLTSGTHTVSIAADSSAFVPAPMGVQDPSKLMSAHYTTHAGSLSDTLVANFQYAMPFLLLQPFTLSQLGVYCATGIDASTSAVGITQCVDGIPGTSYLAQSAITLTSAQNGTFVTANVTDVVLQPGWYFNHIVSTGAQVLGGDTNAVNGWTPLDNHSDTTRITPAVRYRKSKTGGTLDASPETVVGLQNDISFPYIYWVSA